MQKSIGKNTIGGGNKMNVDLRTYNRSTHDLSYIWRNTQAPGTLVPFMVELALPGDTFDIRLNTNVLTHPTIGPLFGSFKLQADIFQCPIRLYHSALHNNALNIGLDMSKIKLPKYKIVNNSDNVKQDGTGYYMKDKINPSSLIAYLGQMGLPTKVNDVPAGTPVAKLYEKVNAIPLLSYWDIYKNYYANKQEEIGAFIHSPFIIKNLASDNVIRLKQGDTNSFILAPNSNENLTFCMANQSVNSLVEIRINKSSSVSSNEMLDNIHWRCRVGKCASILKDTEMTLREVLDWMGGSQWVDQSTSTVAVYYIPPGSGNLNNAWGPDTWYSTTGVNPNVQIETFPLNHLDYLREEILASGKNNEFIVNQNRIMPDGLFQYPIDHMLNEVIDKTNPNTAVEKGYSVSTYSQEGLALKTYQSDLFNNWINTDWIDDPENGINAITRIDTSSGSFNIDQLNLAKKVYDMLNRIAISGGSYKDWVETVYTHESFWMAETPIYEGGMSTEIVFQEVVSSGSSNQTNTGTIQPLGTLAGRGRHSHIKGGDIFIKVNEPSYIIGIVSITPRIDYSQGNRWWINLDNMNQLHKPALDGIGFQDLICENMVASSAHISSSSIDPNGIGKKIQYTAGKQPAWINYMTNYNRTYGNFAIINNQMFMTLNRLYSRGAYGEITDLTTYIEPDKFNYAFAQSDLEAMNFWIQMGVHINARRVMSAKIIPNL